ncbi:DNA-binding CsgD family transcriptional regulator [Kibdelosporangium banguiense]|uniref:DNA-binding CsgD family transcriptional regulator n=1 Tax=Kibdelosporangium banguiense TaxID=1365924 RepID=A0ABS4TVJ3_9PSEU|nr:LuxR C-terminal-related transcriptional regulator [Kibdelosporangium banguiense]MBP2328431.1 DNA-binding CsgD family transcriptional regulator [Kibdelosporangium banguiense]
MPELAALIAESESTELIEHGDPIPLSPVVGRTAHRIVQESLTNIRKHAPGADVLVHVRYSADGVQLIRRRHRGRRRGLRRRRRADHYILRALRDGAVGFLLKSTPPEDLISLVRVAANGHTVLSPAASRRLVATATDRHTTSNHTQALLARLTRRETEILACLGDGLANAQIAARMHLTEGTVKNYLTQILAKLHCANRTQAGLLAHEAGLRHR